MIIELLDGTRYDIEDYNIKRLYHYVPSLGINHNSKSVDGRGESILSSTLTNRIITVELLFETYDIFDFYLLRDELNDIFVREEEFYIIFKNESYHRFRVKLAQGFNVNPNRQIGSFEVQFIMATRYIESSVSTLDMKEWDIDKWAWDGKINWEDELSYSFTNNRFSVYNLGNAEIDPRLNKLDISIRGNFPGRVRIVNESNGDEYIFNGNLSISDILILNGVQSFKNDESVFSQTNRKLLTLKPGKNDFVVYGGNQLNIQFDFNFLSK